MIKKKSVVVRVLVVIANYGLDHQVHLKQLIKEYRAMNYDIDIIIISDIPKDMGSEIEVKVGLPAKNLWSLPFAHRRIFAERLEDYDLFIYSEDDHLITKRNIEAFLNITKVLPADEIAGFFVYEEGPKDKIFCAMHSMFHWIPDSVKSIGKYTFARFTNEHSGCYMVTRGQLERAIGSGGFLVKPHASRYDLACSAASDIYTQCGFTKYICISHIQEFLVHHLPNIYVDNEIVQIKVGSRSLDLHINVLRKLNQVNGQQAELFSTRTKLNTVKWDKYYYPSLLKKKFDSVYVSVPEYARTILSVGCGWGEIEEKLVQKGKRVVGVPLDSVIAESIKSKGIEVTCPDFDVARQTLANNEFDCILFANILQHLPNPAKILFEFKELLSRNGTIIITVPNFKYFRYIYDTYKKRDVYNNRGMFKKTSLHFTTARLVSKWIKQSSLKVNNLKYHVEDERLQKLSAFSLGFFDTYLSPELIFITKKADE